MRVYKVGIQRVLQAVLAVGLFAVSSVSVFAGTSTDLKLSPPPPGEVQSKITDNQLYVMLNGSNSDLYSFTKWLNNSIDAVVNHTAFQDKVEQLLTELLDSPDTPWHDPIIDVTMDVPLFGTVNIGLHFQDIWNTGSGPCSYPPNNSNPDTCTNKAANVFGDSDTEMLSIDWSNISATVTPYGGVLGPTDSMPVTSSGLHATGALDVTIDLDGDIANPAITIDAIMRKPDFPLHITSGVYAHALGKLAVPSASLSVRIYSIGGSFAQTTIAGGYGIGLDLLGLTFDGGIVLDVDPIACGYSGGNNGGYQWTNDGYGGLCHVIGSTSETCGGNELYLGNCTSGIDWTIDMAHPDAVAENAGNPSYYSNWTLVRDTHELHTDELSDFLGEVIQFIEGTVFVDMSQDWLSSDVKSFLTALEITDTTWLTHERSGNNIQSPHFEHPFEEGGKAFFDYGFFYRFAAIDNASNAGVFLPGGFNFAFTGTTNPKGLCATVPGEGVASPPASAPPAITLAKAKLGLANNAPMIGVGVHESPVNEALDSLWRSGFLCFDLWKGTKALGSTVEPLMNVSQMSMFLPSLRSELGDNSVMIKLRPRFSPLNGDPYVQANDQPQFVVKPAAPAVLDGQDDGGTPGIADTRYEVWDARIDLPHLETIFSVDVNGTDDALTFTDVFSADIGVTGYVDLSYYKMSYTDWEDAFPYTVSGGANANPCEEPPYPCRMARAALRFDTTIHHIEEGSNVQDAVNGTDLQKAISSVIGLIFSGKYYAEIEAAINTNPQNATFLGLVLEPYSQDAVSAFDFNNGLSPVDMDSNGDYDYLALYAGIADVNPKDGVADMLDPQLIVDMMVDFGVFPASPGFEGRKGYDPFAQYRNANLPTHSFPETFLKVWNDKGQLQMGAEISLDAKQTAEFGIHPRGGVVFVAPDSMEHARENMWIQYRINQGAYSLPSRLHEIELPFQFDGRHTLEVWAFDPDSFMDPTPAVIHYVIDSQAPRMNWRGVASLADGQYRREFRTVDAVSATDDIQFAYRIDGGAWQATRSPYEVVVSDLSEGVYQLELQAVDEGGNISTLQDTITIGEGGGFGCSAHTGGKPASFAFLFGLILLAWGVHRWRLFA